MDHLKEMYKRCWRHGMFEEAVRYATLAAQQAEALAKQPGYEYYKHFAQAMHQAAWERDLESQRVRDMSRYPDLVVRYMRRENELDHVGYPLYAP